MGIGNEENGDDAAGAYFASLMNKRLNAAKLSSERLTVLNAEKAPENFTGKIRKIAPEFVLLVDAAYLGKGKKPGDIEVFSFKKGDLPTEVLGGALSTHNIPLPTIAEYLLSFVDKVTILAIHVEHLEEFSKMTTPVKERVQGLVDEIFDGLR